MEKAGVSQVSARCSGVMPSESDSHMTAAVVCMINAVAITCGVKSLQVNNRDKPSATANWQNCRDRFSLCL